MKIIDNFKKCNICTKGLYITEKLFIFVCMCPHHPCLSCVLDHNLLPSWLWWLWCHKNIYTCWTPIKLSTEKLFPFCWHVCVWWRSDIQVNQDAGSPKHRSLYPVWNRYSLLFLLPMTAAQPWLFVYYCRHDNQCPLNVRKYLNLHVFLTKPWLVHNHMVSIVTMRWIFACWYISLGCIQG